MIKDVTYWLNSPPSDNGVSDILSPDEILQEFPNPNYDKITIDFGSYTQLQRGKKKLPSQ